jgi:hypothetical protein
MSAIPIPIAGGVLMGAGASPLLRLIGRAILTFMSTVALVRAGGVVVDVLRRDAPGMAGYPLVYRDSTSSPLEVRR